MLDFSDTTPIDETGRRREFKGIRRALVQAPAVTGVAAVVNLGYQHRLAAAPA